jgi:hypothetical protein
VTLGSVDTPDPRNRPVILRADRPATPARTRRSVVGMIAVGVLGTAGLAAGSWSIWSVVGSTAPSGTPTPPLWFTPEHTLSTTDDADGR